ncbi:hypothetical protein NKG05_27735 [Oerskovia sp. M15]
MAEPDTSADRGLAATRAGGGLDWQPDRLLAGFEAATLATGGPAPAPRTGRTFVPAARLRGGQPGRAGGRRVARRARRGPRPRRCAGSRALARRDARPRGAGRLGDRSGAQPAGVFLHVHGYNDYFFQEHLARAVEDAGYVFFAVDLRAAGRSLRPGQVPHFVEDLREPATDLSVAVAVVRGLHPVCPSRCTRTRRADWWRRSGRTPTDASA